MLLVSHDRDFLDRVVTSTIAFEGEGHWTEYAGGYSDMLSQRGAELAEVAPPRDKKQLKLPNEAIAASGSIEPVPATEQVKRKLSFKEKHALERLPGEMKRLEEEISRLESSIAVPNQFTRDPGAFNAATARLAAAQAELGEKESQWLELELMREEIESR